MQACVTIETSQDAAIAVLREALAAAEKRSDAAAAAADAAAAVEAVRSEKEIELRGQLLSLQKQQADAAAAAATAAAASAKRDAAVASLEQRCPLPAIPSHTHHTRPTTISLFTRSLREALANLSEAQRSSQRLAAAAAADKDAGERRLQDAEAKIQEILREMEVKDQQMKCVWGEGGGRARTCLLFH